jgi:hypothetical protein
MVNFADYLLLNIYADTRDWTQNSGARCGKGRAVEFRFTIWDAEAALGLGDDPVINIQSREPGMRAPISTNPGEIALLYQRLKVNAESGPVRRPGAEAFLEQRSIGAKISSRLGTSPDAGWGDPAMPATFPHLGCGKRS